MYGPLVKKGIVTEEEIASLTPEQIKATVHKRVRNEPRFKDYR